MPIKVPSAVVDTPQEISRTPLNWLKFKFTDLVKADNFEVGGHFAAFEQPKALGRHFVDFVAQVEERKNAPKKPKNEL